jgi:hypothetical protein
MSVRVELQADCFAGVWAHHSQKSKQWLDPGDIEAAMNAAQKIGDDALQRSAGRAVVPDSFTHGSSAQRQRWFSTRATKPARSSPATRSARGPSELRAGALHPAATLSRAARRGHCRFLRQCDNSGLNDEAPFPISRWPNRWRAP